MKYLLIKNYIFSNFFFFCKCLLFLIFFQTNLLTAGHTADTLGLGGNGGGAKEPKEHTEDGTLQNIADNVISINGPNVTVTNNGSLTTTGTKPNGDSSAIYSVKSGNNATIINTGTISATGDDTDAIYVQGNSLTINNSGTISSTSGSSIKLVGAGDATINLNEGSKLIGVIDSDSDYTLNMNVGASKSYYISSSGSGGMTVNDLDNRPVISGSAYAINIGSMEMASENLYQKTSNLISTIDRNRNLSSWFHSYYQEARRDSQGSSSGVRKFENYHKGVTAGGIVEDSKIPLQFIMDINESENNIDRGEHIIKSGGVMIGFMFPDIKTLNNYSLSLKSLVGVSNNNTYRKILDNTSPTGERVLTGDYNSFNTILGAYLNKLVVSKEGLSTHFSFGLDIVSERRKFYSENLYFSYDRLNLVQLQPKVSYEVKNIIDDISNTYIRFGLEAREIISGKTQYFSANNTKTSYYVPNNNDVYKTISIGLNSVIEDKMYFFAEVNAKESSEEVVNLLASIGFRATF